MAHDEVMNGYEVRVETAEERGARLREQPRVWIEVEGRVSYGSGPYVHLVPTLIDIDPDTGAAQWMENTGGIREYIGTDADGQPTTVREEITEWRLADNCLLRQIEDQPDEILATLLTDMGMAADTYVDEVEWQDYLTELGRIGQDGTDSRYARHG